MSLKRDRRGQNVPEFDRRAFIKVMTAAFGAIGLFACGSSGPAGSGSSGSASSSSGGVSSSSSSSSGGSTSSGSTSSGGPSASAKIYYVDYAAGSDSYTSIQAQSKSTPWKRAPGMVGFAGAYSHSAGDVFVFKGGTTWPSVCYPWIIANSGSVGRMDTYTVDTAWYSGGTWTRPIFDGGGVLTVSGMIQASAKSYLQFNNLKIANHGIANTSGAASPQAIDFLNCHHLSFTNLFLQVFTQRAMYIHFDSGGAKDSFVFDNIECTNCASLLWFAAGGATTTTNGWRMSNCYIHDFSSQIGNDVHSDGFVHMFDVDSSWTVTNIEFYNNKARGDFRRYDNSSAGVTALFFVEGGSATYSGNCYNNDFALSPGYASAAIVSSYFDVSSGTGAGSLNFYNNTLVNSNAYDASIGAGISIAFGGNGTYAIKNNIISGMRYAFAFVTNLGNTYDCDFNLMNNTSGQNGEKLNGDLDGHFKFYAVWQASPYFFDVHSLLGYSPTYVSTPNDNSLTGGSSGVNAGVNLTSLGVVGLNTDIRGTARPATGAWSMGAYNS